MTDTLKSQLHDLAIASRILGRHGHEDMTLGHVALRDPDGRGIWMKKRGLGLGEVYNANDFLLVDWDGNVLEGTGDRHGEWPIHTEAMLARDDINFSLHSHPRFGTLLSALDCDLPLLTQDGLRLGPKPIARFDATPDLLTTRKQGQNLAFALGDSDIVILQNHGTTIFAASIAKLTLLGVAFERAAQAFIRARATRLPILAAKPQEASKVSSSLQTAGFLLDNWNYLSRELARAEKLSN